MKRLSAFTLAEMLVGLIVLLIVASLSYTALNIIVNYIDKKISQSHELNNLLIANNVLAHKLQFSNGIYALNDKHLHSQDDYLGIYINDTTFLLQVGSDTTLYKGFVEYSLHNDSLFKEPLVYKLIISYVFADTTIVFSYYPNYSVNVFFNNLK